MKTFLTKHLFVTIVAGFALGLLLLLYFAGSYKKEPVSINSIQNDLAPLTVKTAALYGQKTNIGFPARLKIPSIKVDATIEQVGLTPDGAMDVSKGPDDVAWFSLGPRPGEKGSAVIAGHRGWKGGRVAVFDNLDKLHKGDKIYVEDNKGKFVSFVVRETHIYDREAYAPEVFGSEDGIHLNLVTCVGAWDKLNKTSTKRLIVLTDILP